MLKTMIRIVESFLLGVSVLCGPGLWLMAIACLYTAWLLDSSSSLMQMGLLWFSFALPAWAIWGLCVGPQHFRPWWFGLASLFNLFAGAMELNSKLPNRYLAASVFLGYSLWQFIVFRRPAPTLLPPPVA